MAGTKRHQSESSEEEEEEYEVQKIVGHKILMSGKKRIPTLKFHIKWKGYPDSDNTWESQESTDHCQDLVDEYWNSLKNGKSQRVKVERILKGEASESDDDDDFSDNKATPPPKKTSVINKKRRATSPTVEPKKSVAAVASSISKRCKTTQITKIQDTDEEETETNDDNEGDIDEDDEEEEEEEEFSETEIEQEDFRVKSNKWSKDVDKVVKVRNGTDEDNHQDLYGIVRWRDGKLGIYKTSFLTQKIPQLLIHYYEKRLTFESKEQ